MKRWFPLEANPSVLKYFASNLGLDTSKVAFCDVFSLDEGDLKTLLPQPVYAFLLLYLGMPKGYTGDYNCKGKQSAAVAGNSGAFQMTQDIGNACGTIGMLHCVGNNLEVSNLREGSFLQHFFRATAATSAKERGRYLADPPAGTPRIDDAHAGAAQEGDTVAQMNSDGHFSALVCHEDRLLELSGNTYLDHGQTSQESFLQDAASVVRSRTAATDSLGFSLLALTAVALDFFT